MKKIACIFLFVALLSNCFGQQSKDTLFFNKEWKQITSDKSPVFYRVYEKKGNDYLITDNFMSGKRQMVAISSTLNPLNKNGIATFYNQEGYRTKICNYKDNKPFGHCVWYYENEKDSTVADYNADGTKNYTRMGKSEQGINKDGNEEDIYTLVEQMPEYPGGNVEMFKFIQKNTVYPKDEQKNNITGKSFVKFTVEKDGSISNIKIIKSSGNENLDKEALKVVGIMPKWSPGMQKGSPVRVYYNLPINFKL